MDISGGLKPVWAMLAYIVAFPFIQLNQVWSDYQKGRFIRKEVARSQYRCIDKQRANETDHDKADTEADKLRRSWTMRLDHEYPWRIERDIRGGINWKATWVLEVKDLHEIEWETRRIHDGKKWRWHSVPQGHWPFPYERTTPGDGENEGQEDEKNSGRSKSCEDTKC
jgi:hypothetical protein